MMRWVSSITPKSSFIWGDLIAFTWTVGMRPAGTGAVSHGIVAMAWAACMDGTAGIILGITPASIADITITTPVETSARNGGKTAPPFDANSGMTGAMYDVSSGRTVSS